MDSTSIQIKVGNNKIMQVTSVYKSPGAKLEQSDLNALTNHNGLNTQVGIVMASTRLKGN